MTPALTKAKVFIEALPYLKDFDRKFVVIKVGGSTMTDETILSQVVTDVVFLEQVGVWPILVHGGGPAITAAMEKTGLKATFIQGRRITDAPTLDIAHKVLIDHISARVVELIEKAEGKGVPLNGRGSSFLKAQKRLVDGLDLGFVGEITHVDVDLVRRMASGGIIPVVAPIARGVDGQLYNVNADSVAWKVAAEIRAEKLVFLSNVPGILQDKDKPETLLTTLSIEDTKRLTKAGVIVGGMLPKIEACASALEHGVRKTHIISGLDQHSLLLELFTPEGVGTEIHP